MKDAVQQRRAEAMRGLTAAERLERYREAHLALIERQTRLGHLAIEGPPGRTAE